MNFIEFMANYATELDGQYSEYDNNKSVIVVPLGDGRYQTVLGIMRHNEKYNKTGVEFNSKVCQLNSEINLKDLLIENGKFCHAKFVIDDGFVKVEAAAFLDSSSESILKEMITEVANLADEWEMKLTGLDVH